MTQNGFLAGLGGDGPPLLGLFVTMPVPAGVEVAGLAGYDFVIIDLEHTSLIDSDVENLSRAAQLHGMFTMVRTVDSREAGIGRVIETGADGILVPMVEDAATAARIVQASPTTSGTHTRDRPLGPGREPALPALPHTVPPVTGRPLACALADDSASCQATSPGIKMSRSRMRRAPASARPVEGARPSARPITMKAPSCTPSPPGWP